MHISGNSHNVEEVPLRDLSAMGPAGGDGADYTDIKLSEKDTIYTNSVHPSMTHHDNIATDVSPAEYLSLQPFQTSHFRFALFIFLSLITFGILPLISIWYPQLFTRVARSPSKNYYNATHILILSTKSTYSEHVLHHSVLRSSPYIYFEYRKVRYSLHPPSTFVRQESRLNTTLGALGDKRYGLSSEEVLEKQKLYGINEIDIEETSVWSMVGAKLVHPFYLFQAASAAICK